MQWDWHWTDWRRTKDVDSRRAIVLAVSKYHKSMNRPGPNSMKSGTSADRQDSRAGEGTWLVRPLLAKKFTALL